MSDPSSTPPSASHAPRRWPNAEAGVAPPAPVRLLDEIRRVLRVRHYSWRTEASYVAWVRRFIRFSGGRHPRALGAHDVERFLSHLAVDGRVAAGTQNQAFAALLFLYRDVLVLPLGLPEHGTCSRTATTSGRCRSSWGTATCGRR